MFSLNNSDNQPYKMKINRYRHTATYHHNSVGPNFGGGHDLYIADNCDKNTNSFSNLGHTYKLPAGYTYGTTQAKTLLAGSYHFKVDEYEVFFQPGKFTRNDRKINTYILSFSVCLGFCILDGCSSTHMLFLISTNFARTLSICLASLIVLVVRC